MLNEELEFKVGEGEEPATVALSEDGTAEVLDKPQPPAVETTSAAGSEIDNYSDNVKKRIDKLTARLRETQRREQAAMEYARNVQLRAQQLEQQVMHTDGQRIGETKGRIETQAVALKQIIRKAREENDVDTETEAMQRLAMLTNEQVQLANVEAQREAMLAQQQASAQQTNMQPQYQQAQYQQPAQQAQTDPRVEEWAENNPWYGRDTVMTHAAWGIHRQLLQGEGFDPSSDEYYDELNRRIREAFPKKFQSQGSTNNRASGPVQTVAPASRSSGINNARRTVKLTPSQVAIAKKLGVPLEEYAKYVKE